MTRSDNSIDRREMLRRSIAAGFGSAASSLISLSGEKMTVTGLTSEYDKYDALGLAELIAKKQITPAELLDAVRRRVEEINPKLNAFCYLFFDRAEEQIKNGLGNGPFSGVPFPLKDIGLFLKGTITSSGGRVWKGQLADYDSTLVTRYKNAGLVIFGKTSSPELGLTTTTESVLFGQTRNPWDLERTSGGSSGGASSAVASRIVPMAHASDGGGSIRIPASCCGLFGLKPTRGRVPMGPAQFESWNGLSAHHALTISVRDSAALLDVSSGVELGSPYYPPPQERHFLKEVGADPGKLRIALIPDAPAGTPIDPECRKAAMEAAKLCESLGHKVEESKWPIDAAMMRGAFLTIINVSVARALDDGAKMLGRPVTEKDVEPVTWVMAQQGQNVSSVAYARAIGTLHQIGLMLAKFQQTYDIILNPTLGKPPVSLGLLSLTPKDMQTFTKEITEFSPFTAVYNATGQPSMSVPLHWTPNELPVGVMFTARFGDEATLFRLAAQLEKAKPWAERRPKI